MNERIEKLAKDHLIQCEHTEYGWQECYRYEFEPNELEDFVGSIVKGCCDWIDGSPVTESGQLILTKSFIIANLKGYFGVEK